MSLWGAPPPPIGTALHIVLFYTIAHAASSIKQKLRICTKESAARHASLQTQIALGRGILSFERCTYLFVILQLIC